MSGFIAEVNIGLLSAETGERVSPASELHARKVLESAGYIESWAVKTAIYSREGAPEEQIEPTIVARVWVTNATMANWAGLLHVLAKDLQQDCIAWYSPRWEAGALLGPKAMDWGTFNPAYFHRPETLK